MSAPSHIVKYACSPFSKFMPEIADRIRTTHNIQIQQIVNVGDLFQLISDCTQQYDLIIIELEVLDEIKSQSISNLINTMTAIIECNKESLNPRLAIACNIDTESKTIKQILNTNILGIYPQGDQFTFEEKSLAVLQLLNGTPHVPTAIKELIEVPKRCTNCKQGLIILTPRESQILSLIQDRGVSNKVIAKMLRITESTVKLHITHILKKYGVNNRTQLALFSKDNTQV